MAGHLMHDCHHKRTPASEVGGSPACGHWGPSSAPVVTWGGGLGKAHQAKGQNAERLPSSICFSLCAKRRCSRSKVFWVRSSVPCQVSTQELSKPHGTAVAGAPPQAVQGSWCVSELSGHGEVGVAPGDPTDISDLT